MGLLLKFDKVNLQLNLTRFWDRQRGPVISTVTLMGILRHSGASLTRGHTENTQEDSIHSSADRLPGTGCLRSDKSTEKLLVLEVLHVGTVALSMLLTMQAAPAGQSHFNMQSAHMYTAFPIEIWPVYLFY